MKRTESEAIFEAARSLIPGGVNSPVRAYRGVGHAPPHIASGKGALVTDVDGNEYVDMVLAYGPLILGHGHSAVTDAVHSALDRGTAFGAPTEGELRLAERIVERVPGMEMVRLVNSGTEATMSALRLARAATGRSLYIKFDGCYHGHGDAFLVRAGSGALTHGAPDSPGVPAALAELTLVAPYNDLDAVRVLFENHPDAIAAIFVEPVAGNMGCIRPDDGYLEGLRKLCDEHGALLVFDEVMTGFRVSRGGYQDLTPVRCDLITLGKVIGAGFPIGAYGGRADLMQKVSPAGDVYQAGTLSGNPIAVTAGIAALQVLDNPDTYTGLEARSAQLADGLQAITSAKGIPLFVGRVGSMMCPYFSAEPIHNLDQVSASDRDLWMRVFRGLLDNGVIVPPSPYEAWFLSTAHDEPTIARVLEAFDSALTTA
ncbi:MAG: glutamate-1-semialdehyde 2,1-aminomutase [Chlamydiales bacterium]